MAKIMLMVEIRCGCLGLSLDLESRSVKTFKWEGPRLKKEIRGLANS
jgi:hypothetical protein